MGEVIGETWSSAQQQSVLARLQTPDAIRQRCRLLLALAGAGESDHFRVQLDRLEPLADYVVAVMREAYPTLAIPFHSRWRHFEVEGQSRLMLLEPYLGQRDALERARMLFDLGIISVLLDAGSGPDWCYREASTGMIFSRSEGLAIARFHGLIRG